jgi:hypothetical protein
MKSWHMPFLPFVLLSSLVSAAEPDYGRLPDELPILMEQIREHNETLQQALESPRAVDRSALTKPEPEAANAPAPAPIPQVRSDPFQVSYFMQQKALARNQGGPQFTPLQGAQTPTLSLKGIVNGEMALLEVQGSGVYLVREGDTLSLNRQGQNTVMKIEKIDRLSLMVKMGTLAEIIVVR